ncbi:MAG: LPS export ABC transporter periplasmic protein LptC [Verrucomicrobiae bacterium]|nr:LPS export ABC transporter periplasmic protein LptC [Verrucomicrobiae bacterium]
MSSFHRSLPLGLAIALLAGIATTGSLRLKSQAQDATDKPAIRRPEPVPVPATVPDPAPKPTSTPAPVAEIAPDSPPAASDSTSPSPDSKQKKISSAESEESDTPESEGAEDEGSNMAALFPIGRVFEGVKIPSYSGDALGSVIHADYMRRADDEHLEMEMLEIVVYNAGEADSRILTDRAIYDMKAKTLRSTTPAKIVQKQFEMRGDRMFFDSITRVGHMDGNVKTLIYQVDQFVSPSSPSAPPSSTP